MLLRLLLVLSLFLGLQEALQLDVVNQWSFLDFDLPFHFDYRDIKPENTLFTGLEVTDNRIFLAMPRLRAGVPATLATISRNTPKGSSPILKPYPDWSFHGPARGDLNCSNLISIYRMRIDSCNNLWVLDSGVIDSLDEFTRVCQPKLVVFNLFSDRILRIIYLPNGVLRPYTLLTNLVIDESIQGRCESSFVYMTDTAAPGLIVYDGLRDTAWRFTHPTMYPDPNFSDYNINGEGFTLMDGVVGITHSPKLATVYYQPLATDRIFSVATSELVKGPPGEFERLPVSFVGKKSSQGLGLTVNLLDDTIYFSPLTETSIASWNPITNAQKDNLTLGHEFVHSISNAAVEVPFMAPVMFRLMLGHHTIAPYIIIGLITLVYNLFTIDGVRPQMHPIARY